MYETTRIVYKWNPQTKNYDLPQEIALVRPDQWNNRGGPICAVCGERTRTVLDGEAWCNRCERYQ